MERNSAIGPAVVSLVVGIGVFGAKLYAWRITGSAAVFSDALESIVNVVAAGFSLAAIRFAAEPPDAGHPYGHGKVEYLSAGFEGGLVSFAAIGIVLGAVDALVTGPTLEAIDVGLAITAAAGAVNLGLGAWLVRRGKAVGSPALVADGKHVLSDVWTTVGVLIGLGLVQLTGAMWLDPLAALAVGVLLATTGWGLVREATGGLLDAEDPELVRTLCASFHEDGVPGVILLHELRVIRSGRDLHIDCHAFAPSHWTVEQGHTATETLEQILVDATGLDGDLALHLDPCMRAHCIKCDLPECPFRVEPFSARVPGTPAQVTGLWPGPAER